MSSTDLITRYLNQPARRCSRCGSEIVCLTPAGALSCLGCNPDARSAAIAILVARANAEGFKLHWVTWSEDFDGPLSVGENRSAGGEPSEPDAAESRGVQGGGFGVGSGGESQAGAWGVGAAAEPFAARQADRIDPAPPVDVVLVVSPRLDWFASGSAGLFGLTGEIRDTEFAGEFTDSRPAGVFRPISQAYLGWLVGQIENARAAGKLRGQDLDDAKEQLAEIAFAAFGAGIFGEWAIDPAKFPQRPPAGYIGPGKPRGLTRLVEWNEVFEKNLGRAKARS